VPATLITAANLFDGERRLADAAVLVEQGRVTWIGRATDAPRTAARATEMAAPSGSTLLPGFIDCHVHLALTAAADIDRDVVGSDALFALRAYANASRALRAGVTTQRDLGAPTFAVIELGKAIARGDLVGPNIIACGRGITTTGGHGWQIGRVADGADEVRKAVREQLFGGASVIKLFSTGGVLGSGAHPDVAQLTEAETRAAIEEAHKGHTRVAAHAHAAAGMRIAIEAGVDSIEHATLLDRETIRLCKERGTALVPTFAALRAIIRNADKLDPAILERGKTLVDKHREGIRAAHRAGVPIATGTDSGTPFNYTHEYANEIEALTEVGLSLEQALRAATSVAADVVGRADLGRLRAGSRADMVALHGDPFADTKALWAVAAVWKDGVAVNEA
jgi:imidazolonepropionase-like amidohydrolase